MALGVRALRRWGPTSRQGTSRSPRPEKDGGIFAVIFPPFRHACRRFRPPPPGSASVTKPLRWTRRLAVCRAQSPPNLRTLFDNVYILPTSRNTGVHLFIIVLWVWTMIR